MPNTSGLWRGGSPGRPSGARNRVTREAHAFCERLVADPEYRTNFEARWRGGTLPPALEMMVWSYAIGKPQQSLEVTSHGASLAELIAGRVPNDEDPERDESSGQPSANGGR